MIEVPSAYVELPFSRPHALLRLEGLVHRYAWIRAWLESGAPDSGVAELLRRHPTAYREARATSAARLGARGRAVREELTRVRAAAPLPPGAPSRRKIHALSELEVLLRAGRSARYRTRRDDEDPIVETIEGGLAGGGEPHRRLAILLQWVARRYALVDQWWDDLWGGVAVAIDVGPEDAFPLGTVREVVGFDEPVIVVRTAAGLSALSGVCPHRGGILSDGEVRGDAVICPIHGWAFDLHTGVCAANPQYRAATYGVRVEDGRVHVRREGSC